MKLFSRRLASSFALFFTAGSLFIHSVVTAEEPRWAPWVEPNFPFFSSSLDLQVAGSPTVPRNIVPRGLILNLGSDVWACFDTELLRLAAVWTGKGTTADALAQLSYQNGNIKTVGGQSKLPKPNGPIWLSNGVFPGWQRGSTISLEDPRAPQPSPEEPGRGPLAADQGRFKAVRLKDRYAVLEYEVAGVAVKEAILSPSGGRTTIHRCFEIGPRTETLSLILCPAKMGEHPMLVIPTFTKGSKKEFVMKVEQGMVVLSVLPGTTSLTLDLLLAQDAVTPMGPTMNLEAGLDFPTSRVNHFLRWPDEVWTKATVSASKEALVTDDIPLPTNNPWRRNVRLADIAFFKDGTAAGVTLDGDVWLIKGLKENLGQVSWKRFASGLHEPGSLAIRDEQIYVFDRNGIWRLRDTDGDGEADVHELFSNVFPQSAESREFTNSLKLAPDGSFVIAKGGQQESSLSKYNGSVLRVAADGQSFTALGVGFRQPFAGVNPKTGLVTASDQEGQYTPTTPLHLVKDGTFHGFLSPLLPKEKYPAPIADPLTWVPHSVNPSAASQVWLYGTHFGPLEGSLVHVGFNRPELFRVLINERSAKPQAAVVSLLRDFDLPTLNAAVNPADGWLYMTGFQVVGWGTTAKRLSGLMRVRYTGAPVVQPREVVPMDKGVLLRFDVALDPNTAADPASYSLESWHYQRTWKYGSPHLKADGSPGQDWITPTSAYLSKDGRSVFVGVPDMKPVMQMRIGWALKTPEGVKVEDNAYFTPYDLPKFDPGAEGFAMTSIDFTPRKSVVQAAAPASEEEGRKLYQLMGCMACHATDDSVQMKIGPSWKKLFGSTRDIANGPKVSADEAYIKESILTPGAKTVKGYEKVEAGMPVYAGVLNDSQIESIILFIKSLK